MEICGQYFSKETMEWIKAELETNPKLSRRGLARRICMRLNWRGPSGKYKEMSCRKALVELDHRGAIRLLKSTQKYPFQRRVDQSQEVLPELGELRCSFKELGGVEIVLVSSRYSKLSKVWNSLMDRYHYLGSGPLCGAQMRYLIRSRAYGYLGGLSFSGATWRLKARDGWIGWSEGARLLHLQEVVGNSRFLILPRVKVAHLASHVLARCLSQLPEDWQKWYGYKPLLVETFVDPQRFLGTSYKAANFIYLGKTAGRDTPYANGKISNGAKDVYGYPLQANWRELLCLKPERRLCSRQSLEAPTDWVEEEFGRVELYDGRLRERLYTLTRDFYAKPGALVPQACNGSEAKMKGAYRFFSHHQADLQTLLKPHIEATVERIKAHKVVLAVQDTTSLNYTSHPADEGIGPINTTEDAAVGLLLHDTLAFTVEGTPLGLVDAQCWARDPEKAGKSHQRKELPIEAKESMKWLRSYQAAAQVQSLCPETRLISVGDREADLYELFAEAEKNLKGPKLLVRAERSRNRQVEEGALWEHMEKEPLSGYQEIYIPRKGSRASRIAKLAVRFAFLTLKSPKGKTLPPVKVWAVYTKEIDPSPDVKEPLEWMLLATVETMTFDEACERIKWYALRWGIEVYHRTLKSGCRIEDRRLDTAKRIQACLAIDLVVAWRIYFLTKQGRETPHLPCDVFLSEEEWKALYAYIKKEPPPEKPPSLREATRMIASLGGFLGRKGDGDPGTTTMWRGLQRLADLTQGYLLGQSFYLSRASP